MIVAYKHTEVLYTQKTQCIALNFRLGGRADCTMHTVPAQRFVRIGLSDCDDIHH
jgi:hypothetical protein